MSDACNQCGRPTPVPSGPACHRPSNPEFCFVGTGYWDPDHALLDCQTQQIKKLRAQVHHLEGQLENYDTVDAENHAVEEVVKKLNRIIDEQRQVGKFGGESLQRLAERLLGLQKQERERCAAAIIPDTACYCSDYLSAGIPCPPGKCPSVPKATP